MKILLVDILRTSIHDVWPTAEHATGLLYIAAVLKQEFGEEIKIRIRTLVSKPDQVDADQEWMLSELEQWKPDVVGMRCLTIGADVLHTVAPVVKQWNGDCFLVTGGPYASDNPAEAMSNGVIDCAAIGEGEFTMRDIVSALLVHNPLTGIQGIAYYEKDQLMITDPRGPINDLDSLPFPDYSLIDFNQFANRYLTFSSRITQPHANILTTRGCPYHCAYCHNILGKTFRARSPENVLAEIRLLYDQHGITDFQIIDDIFNLDKVRAKEICDLIIESDMEITLSFPNGVRGDRMDEELIDKMVAAGTRFMSYAVETASPRLQRLINKNLDLERVFNAIKYSADAGIITRGYFMLGFPSETEEEALETIEFAKASSLCGAIYFNVVYFPGTELYRLAQRCGYFKDVGYEVHRDYVQIGDGPYEFDVETLAGLKKKAIREFAFTRERIENAFRLLPRYYGRREMDGLLMAYIVSSGTSYDEVEDETVKQLLRRHFAVAKNFSNRNEFYV